MEGRILKEFDIVNPWLVQIMASRRNILKLKGEQAWSRLYKSLCNHIRKSYSLGKKAITVSTFSDREGLIDFKNLHITVLDYDIGETEHFFADTNRLTNEFIKKDTNLDKELEDQLRNGDDTVGKKILNQVAQATIINPYIVQMMLSEPFIIQKQGDSRWSEMYLKHCLDVQDQLGKEDVTWLNGTVILGFVSDEMGVVDYRQVNVVRFDHDLTSHSSYGITQDAYGNIVLTLNEEEE